MICPNCKSENPDTQSFCGDCGTQLTPSEPNIGVTKTLETPILELAGGILFAGRYKIVEKLGRGGMGEVYRVKDEKLDEEMALKVIRPEIASSTDIIERFKNELKLARKIANKHVCKMYDLNEEVGIPYLTMEYVEGEDLKTLIRRKGNLSQKDAIAIAKQVSEGLSGAHELGVIHRDLKPQNIMIDKNGNAKVMDFGIARSIEAPGMTHSGVMIGTPDYISPEQAEGEKADQRSDIYSLGVILFEMMTGQLPFQGDTALSVALKHKSRLPQEPKKLNPAISNDLSRLILICLEKDRERRYKTAAELLTDIQNVEQGRPLGTKIKPRRPTIIQKTSIKTLIFAATVVVLAILALIILKPWSPSEKVPVPEDRPAIAILPFTNNTGDPELDSWRNALANALEFNLSLSKHLYIVPRGRLVTVFDQLDIQNDTDYSSMNLENLAARGIGPYFLTGDYFKSGMNIRITFTLQDVRTPHPLVRDSVEREGEDSLLPLVDEISDIVRQNLKISDAELVETVDRAFGQLPTTSLEAFRYYSEGASLYFQNKLAEATPLFEKALSIDPNLALAYHCLANIYIISNRGEIGREYLIKALEHSQNIPERHRLLIQAHYAWRIEQDNEKARSILEEMLQGYPDDLHGNRMLALQYSILRNREKAIEYFEKAVQLHPESPFDYNNLLGLAYPWYRAYDKAIETAEIALKKFPNDLVTRHCSFWTYLNAGEYSLAEDLLDKYPSSFRKNMKFGVLMSSFPLGLYRAWIYQLRGDLIRAEEEYQSLDLQNDYETSMWGKHFLGHLRLQQGKYKATADLFIELINESAGKGDPYYTAVGNRDLAYIHLRQNRPREAVGASEKAWKSFSNIKENNIRISLDKNFAAVFYGQALLLNESWPEAEAFSSEFKESLESGLVIGYRMDIGWHKYYQGILAAERKVFDEGKDFLYSALDQIALWPIEIPNPYSVLIEPLAKTYYLSGELDKASQEYEKIASLNFERLAYGDVYVHSFYMLGKIYEEQGNKTKAVENFERFLDLWQDADPGLPEVEDARKRVAALQNNQN